MSMVRKGMILALASVWLTTAYAGEKVSQTLPVDSDSRVFIDNLRGEVKVLGWDKKEVSVTGELDEQTKKFIFEERDSRVIIKVIVPENNRTYNHNQGGSTLTIMVPSQSMVNFNGVSTDLELKNLQRGAEAKTVSGNIEASGLANRVEINSVSGNIESEALKGKIMLSTVSGDIEDLHSTGRLSFQTVSGDLKVTSAATDVTFRTVSGDLEARLEKVEEVKLNTVSGDLKAKMSLADDSFVKASSVSGSVKLILPENTSADFSLRSNAGGRISNKLTDDQVIRAKYGPGAKLNFTTGSALSSVQVSTVSGNIKLVKD